MLLLVIAIIYAAYFGLKQSKVLVPYFLLEYENIDKSKKQSTDNNSITEFKTLEQKLKSIIVERKPYLDTELTLGKLAELTAISDKKLSALLNQHMNISFYDFVNGYRINAFKDLIKSGASGAIDLGKAVANSVTPEASETGLVNAYAQMGKGMQEKATKEKALKVAKEETAIAETNRDNLITGS